MPTDRREERDSNIWPFSKALLFKLTPKPSQWGRRKEIKRRCEYKEHEKIVMPTKSWTSSPNPIQYPRSIPHSELSTWYIECSSIVYIHCICMVFMMLCEYRIHSYWLKNVVVALQMLLPSPLHVFWSRVGMGHLKNPHQDYDHASGICFEEYNRLQHQECWLCVHWAISQTPPPSPFSLPNAC